MPWNNSIFRAIVSRAAEGQGKNLTKVQGEIGAKSRLSHDYVNGPQVDIFEKLMPALGWQPADVLCAIAAGFGWDQRAVDEINLQAPRDPNLVETATRIALRGLGREAADIDILPGTVADVYDVLLERRQAGGALDEAFLAGIEATIRRRGRR